jgi:hypothetical protein
MIGYKFLPERFAAGAAEGRFRISLLTVFNSTEDDGIRDEDDGKTVGYTNEAFEISENSPDIEFRERMERHRFMRADNGGRIINQGHPIRFEYRIPPTYVLCLTTDKNCRKWLDDDDPKDAVITIPHVNVLADAIWRRHPDIVGRPIVKRVRYDQRRADMIREDFLPLDPFSKRPDFQDEKELRILFPAVGEPKAEWFMSDCPNVAYLLSWEWR